MSFDRILLDRRNVHERKAIRLLRGESVAHILHSSRKRTDFELLSRRVEARFSSIRHGPIDFGYGGDQDRPAYVSHQELEMLRWLAEAQRKTGIRSCGIADGPFLSHIEECALGMKVLGLSLPYQTLYLYPVRNASVAARISPPAARLRGGLSG